MLRWTLLAIVSGIIGVSCSSGAKKSEPVVAAPAKAAASATKVGKKDAPAKAQAASAGAVECTNKKDVRTIEVKAKDKGCETVYTKFGKADSVATSPAGTAHCDKTLEKIKTKLTASGFACK